MTKLTYNGVEYNILYIDPRNTENPGDGSTPANALSNIPNPLVDKTCYLIRRCEDDNEYQQVDMPQSWWQELYDIMFLGMPTPDSPLWDLLEEDVKAAWGSDTGTWARVRCNMSEYTDWRNSVYPDYNSFDSTNVKILFKNNTLRNFIADGCYFFRDGGSGYVDDRDLNLDYMFAFTHSDKTANINFNNCKFGYQSYNFENELYLRNNDITCDERYSQYKCKAYLFANALNSFVMNDCIINVVPGDFGDGSTSRWQYSREQVGTGKVFYIKNCNNIILDDINYNVFYRDNYWYNNDYKDYQGFYFNNSDDDEYYSINYGRKNLTINNLSINNIFKQRQDDTSSSTGWIVKEGDYTGRIITYRGMEAHINNININWKVMGGGQVSGVRYNSGFEQLYLKSSNILNVNGINVNYGNSNIKDFKVAYFNTFGQTPGTINSKIKNVYIKMDANGNCGLGSSILYLEANNDMYKNSSELIYNNGFKDNSTFMNYSKSWIGDNIVIDAPNTNGRSLELYRCGVKSPYINGKVYLNSGTLDVDKLCNNISTSYGVEAVRNSYLKCNEYIANLSYPAYTGQKQMSFELNGCCSAYVYKTNSIIFDENSTYTNYKFSSNNMLVCPNYILDGQFFARSDNAFAKSWNVLRSGSESEDGSSANGSLRFNQNWCAQKDSPHYVIVGQEPYKGIQIQPQTIGKKVLTAYIACKNFDTSELDGGPFNCLIKVNCPEIKTLEVDETKTYVIDHTYESTPQGWKSSNSSWTNDSNLVPFKVEIPVEVFTTEEPINIQIWYNWYSVNGVTYVDPDFKLTDVA